MDKSLHSYNPYKKISLDERINASKNICSLLLYCKGKPDPWGIKSVVISDRIGYTRLYREINIGVGIKTIKNNIQYSNEISLTLWKYRQNSFLW